MSTNTGRFNRVTRLGSSLTNESGATTLEFTFFITSFLIILFFFIELCRVIFISAALDLAVAQSGRAASFDSNAAVNYTAVFKKSLAENSRLWPFLGNDDDIEIKPIKYCVDVQQLIDDTCSSTQSPSGSVLAIYSIQYAYSPVLAKLLLMSNFNNSMLKREVIYVQQYELVQ